MYLSEQRVVWKYPQGVGYVVAPLMVSASMLNEIPPVLYTTTAVVDSKDGSILFAYPAGARFGCISDKPISTPRSGFYSDISACGNL
jgi:hypothetical protein